MVFHGLWLVSMVFQVGFMVFHGFRLVSMVFHGFRLVCHGYRLVFLQKVPAPNCILAR